MRNQLQQPYIDVLIPVYNAAPTVESAVRSICGQTLKEIRIIVIDDGSTDATPSILERLAREDRRIHVITTANNGIVDALNTGLAASSADLIARFDADDIAFPDRLEVQSRFLAEHADCIAVGCNVHFIDDQGRRTGKGSNFPFIASGDPFYAPAREPYLLHPFLLVRRRAIPGVDAYRYVFHSEDADLYWRLGDAGALINLPDFLGEYRVHSGSVSGYSALNGRIAAISAQLAALSERRRKAGLPDIEFPRSMLAEYKSVQALDKIIEVGGRGLSNDEKAYLSIATAAKLLELSSYRPYRLEAADFRTMRSIIYKHQGLLTRANRVRLLFRQVLAPNGLRSMVELLPLMPWRMLPSASLELLAYLVSKRRDGTPVG